MYFKNTSNSYVKNLIIVIKFLPNICLINLKNFVPKINFLLTLSASHELFLWIQNQKNDRQWVKTIEVLIKTDFIILWFQYLSDKTMNKLITAWNVCTLNIYNLNFSHVQSCYNKITIERWDLKCEDCNQNYFNEKEKEVRKDSLQYNEESLVMCNNFWLLK